jgi:citrate lyase subunit beta / citryl-CoA lyase
MHPREVLLGSQAAADALPVVDHYSGVDARMRKSLDLQAELIREYGACVMDVTLDCEDGAPTGAEVEHANLVLSLVHNAPAAIESIARRIGVRLHAIDHSAFASDVEILVGGAAQRLSHVMIPKVERVNDVNAAMEAIDAAGGSLLPLHVLIESSGAVARAFEIAAHPRVQSISFGLMDFVSSHGGAIPSHAMSATGQFKHPLVQRAKLEIAAACHANGKVPSHCVVTEFSDTEALEQAAQAASQQLGYTRMWSIHPAQVRPILTAFAPTLEDVSIAAKIVAIGADCNWAPASFDSQLHDRASYRYYWQLLERAQRTGRLVSASLPSSVRDFLSTSTCGAQQAVH